MAQESDIVKLKKQLVSLRDELTQKDELLKLVYADLEQEKKNYQRALQQLNTLKTRFDKELLQRTEALEEELKERHLAEERLSKSKANLKAMFDCSLRAYHLIAPDYCLLTINRFAIRHYEEVYGRVPQNGDSILDYVGQVFKNSFIRDFQKALSGEIVRFERRFNYPTGRVAWFEIIYLPVYDEKEQLFAVAYTANDITERKLAQSQKEQSEIKLRSFLQQSNDGIVLTDSQGKIVEWNKAMCRITGLLQEDVLGQTIWDVESHLLPEERRTPEVEEKIRRIVLRFYDQHNTSKRSYIFNGNIVKPDGQQKTVQAAVFSVKVGANFMIGKIIRDITQRHRIEQELKELNATKDKFFSIIAHDLRNPFGNISNFAEWILENIDELSREELLEYVGMMYQSSQHGFNLLSNLLDWSRSQTGRIDFMPELINIYSIIQENIDLLMPTAQSKNIRIVNHVTSGLQAFADSNMVKTIVRNLLGNAIKFTPENGVVNIKSQEKAEQVEISVSDTGVGIPPQDIDKIFRIDVSYSTSGTGQEEGTGLGLILCKEFVEYNGGRLYVESKEGEGSRFYFTLPCKDVRRKTTR